MTPPAERSGGRPRKAPLGMNASRLSVEMDRETRRALEELLFAWRLADTSRSVSRADVVRALLAWASDQVKCNGNPGFLPRKRQPAG